jgi:hypothetical protein
MTRHKFRRAPRRKVFATVAACWLLVAAPVAASYDAPARPPAPLAHRSGGSFTPMKLAQSLPPPSEPLPGSRPEGAAPPPELLPGSRPEASSPSPITVLPGSRPEASGPSPITVLPGTRPDWLNRESLSVILPGTRLESVAPRITDLFHGF